MPVILKLRKTTEPDTTRGWVSAEFYDIIVGDRLVGTIQLRLGNTEAIRLHGGHVGYDIDPEHRGCGYASAALRHLVPIADRHGFEELWITCRPDNIASRRTLEKAGASYVDTVAVPPTSDLYSRGEHEMRRYRLSVSTHKMQEHSAGVK